MMEEGEDVLNALKRALEKKIWSVDVIEAAIKEIEFLRSRGGAMTPGPELSDIKDFDVRELNRLRKSAGY